MHLLHPIPWETILNTWRSMEANWPHWIAHYTAEGYTSWDAWRSHLFAEMNPTAYQWNLYAFDDIAVEIPAMYIGPFRGWRTRVAVSGPTFGALLQDPVQREFFSAHERIGKIRAVLPFPTLFMGFRCRETGEIMCLDGHHRAVAYTLWTQEGHTVDAQKSGIHIALADISLAYWKILVMMHLPKETSALGD